MPISKSRAEKTARIAGQTKNSKRPDGAMWDKPSLQEFDGRVNTQSGDAGKEPGGRWSEAYYERPAAIVGRNTVRKPGA